MFFDVQKLPRNHLEMVLSLCDKYVSYKLQFVPIFYFLNSYIKNLKSFEFLYKAFKKLCKSRKVISNWAKYNFSAQDDRTLYSKHIKYCIYATYQLNNSAF